MAKSLGHDPNCVRVTTEAGICMDVGERSYILNHDVVRTKDGRELLRAINVVSVKAVFGEVQEELAEPFACGEGVMGIILSGGEMHVFVNPNTRFRPLLRLDE